MLHKHLPGPFTSLSSALLVDSWSSVWPQGYGTAECISVCTISLQYSDSHMTRRNEIQVQVQRNLHPIGKIKKHFGGHSIKPRTLASGNEAQE